MREIELARGMGIGVDAHEAAEPQGRFMPAPVKIEPPRVCVDLDRDAMLGTCRKHLLNVDVVAHLTHWGVEMARKGGVPKDRVLNCLRKDELASYLEKRRARRRPKRVSPQRRSLRPRASAAGIEKRAAPRKNRKTAVP